MAALPVQIAAPTLLTATKTSPISAAYTAEVENNLEPRRLFEVVFEVPLAFIFSTRGP